MVAAGSLADPNPALNTAKRVHTADARSSAPPTAVTGRRRPAPARARPPAAPSTVAALCHRPATLFIGDGGRTTRSMLTNRAGRPRSEINRPGLASAPATATRRLSRARCGRPDRAAAAPRTDDAPARPPVKRYQGISGLHTGS